MPLPWLVESDDRTLSTNHGSRKARTATRWLRATLEKHHMATWLNAHVDELSRRRQTLVEGAQAVAQRLAGRVSKPRLRRCSGSRRGFEAPLRGSSTSVDVRGLDRDEVSRRRCAAPQPAWTSVDRITTWFRDAAIRWLRAPKPSRSDWQGVSRNHGYILEFGRDGVSRRRGRGSSTSVCYVFELGRGRGFETPLRGSSTSVRTSLNSHEAEVSRRRHTLVEGAQAVAQRLAGRVSKPWIHP